MLRLMVAEVKLIAVPLFINRYSVRRPLPALSSKYQLKRAIMACRTLTLVDPFGSVAGARRFSQHATFNI